MSATGLNPPLPQGLLARPVAHRALHDRARGIIENSRAAIVAAIAHDHAIELDLQLSSDGEVMVFHDDTLERLTARSGPVGALDAASLGATRLTGCDETIPTLREVLALVAGRAPLLLELKSSDPQLEASDGRLEAATAAALADYSGEVALMSFNPTMMRNMARLAPGLPRGLTTAAFGPDWSEVAPARRKVLAGIPDLEATGASFISHEAADLQSSRVRGIAASGLSVLCWTIRSPEAEAEARKVARNVTFEGYLPARP